MKFDFASQGDTIEIISGDGSIGNALAINQVTLIKDCHVETDGKDNIFGTAVGKYIIFTIDTTEILEGTIFRYWATVTDTDGTETSTLVGIFTAVDLQTNSTTTLIKVTGIDNMINFNIPYNTALTYPTTLWNVVTELCSNCGVTLSADQPANLVNKALSVASNRFTNGELCRDVLAQAAAVLGAFAQIVNDELRFIAPTTSDASIASVSEDDYSSLQLNHTIRPYNSVTIRSSLNDDDITTMTASPTGAAPEPTMTLLIQDNEFLFDAVARSAAINGIFTNACAFGYYPFEADGVSHPALNCGDLITVFDGNGVEYKSFILHMEYYSGDESQGANDMISAPALSVAALDYTPPVFPAMKMATKAYEYTSNVDQVASAAAQAVNNPGASYIKWKKTAGDVLTDCNVTDSPEQLWVTSKETVDDTTTVFKIDSAGFGLSFDGGATYDVSAFASGLLSRILTAGKITVDDITAGTLSSAFIFAGILAAASGTFTDLIAGNSLAQHLHMGYDTNNDPFIDIFDMSNALSMRIKKDGLTYGNGAKTLQYGFTDSASGLTVTGIATFIS